MDEATLWAAMAIRPIDADAIRARRQTWGTARSSIHLGMLICALIFLTVPPIYLLDTFVPLFIGVPLIAGIAVWKSVRLLGAGLDRAYEGAGRAMAPLGLAVVEHPEVAIRPKGAAPYRMGADLRGALVLEGDRHGHHVTVRMPTSAGVRSPSQVRLSLTAPGFDFKVRDGRLKAGKSAPDQVAALLKDVPNSTRWNGVRGEMADGAPGDRPQAREERRLAPRPLARRTARGDGGPVREGRRRPACGAGAAGKRLGQGRARRRLQPRGASASSPASR